MEFLAGPFKAVVVVPEDGIGLAIVELRKVNVEFGVRCRYNDQLGFECSQHDAPELFQHRWVQVFNPIDVYRWGRYYDQSVNEQWEQWASTLRAIVTLRGRQEHRIR